VLSEEPSRLGQAFSNLQGRRLTRVLLPRATAIFVPAAFVVGLFIWLNARPHADHFSPAGKWITTLWWMIYPLIGYYVSLGWDAAGTRAYRELRRLSMRLAIKASNFFIGVSCFFMGLLLSIFGVRNARRTVRDIRRLWSALNRLLILFAVRFLGRLVSAWLVALPQTAWRLFRRRHRPTMAVALLMHLLGLLPGLLVFSVFFAPLAEQSQIQAHPNMVQRLNGAHARIATKRGCLPPLPAARDSAWITKRGLTCLRIERQTQPRSWAPVVSSAPKED
jgi:hypothetical protein